MQNYTMFYMKCFSHRKKVAFDIDHKIVSLDCQLPVRVLIAHF